ncbi:MAG: YraN family protein [Candidatus Pacebacteria bacterium]|nr:YraN family protein [Candidatus Paceibacterota bacterium]
MNTRKIGNFGEKIASDYLEKKGYQILGKNYSRKWIRGPQKGEIDVIAEKDKIISFIEVKTITSAQGGDYLPEDKVNFQKQKQLIKIAQDWLSEKKIPLESKWQIDVMAIKIDLESKKAKIRHIQNAIGA